MQNFATVDRFLADPGGSGVRAVFREVGAQNLRFLLRRNAAEENVRVVERSQWAQSGVLIAFFFLVAFGERPPRSVPVMIAAMLAIVLVQYLALSPSIATIGRELDGLTAGELVNDPMAARFDSLNRAYGGSEILKLLLGIGVASQLMNRRSSKGHGPQKTQAHVGGPDSMDEGLTRKRRRASDSTNG
jgi:hypothetical protein